MAKKQIIDIGIKTDFLDRAQLESYQKSLLTLKKDAKSYGANLNSINAALTTLNEIIQNLPKSGKVNIQQTTQLKNLFAELSSQAGRLYSQISSKDTSKDLQEVNRQIDEQTKLIDQLTKSQQKLTRERDKQVKESETSYIIKANKKTTGRSGDNRVDKLLRKADKNKQSVAEYGAANNFSEEEIKQAQKLQEQYHQSYLAYSAQVDESIQTINNNLNTTIDQLEKAQATLVKLQSEQASLQSGNLTEDQSSMASTLSTLSNSAQSSQQHMSTLGDQLKSTGAATVDLNKAVDKSTNTFGKAARAALNYSFVYKTAKKLLKEAINVLLGLDQALTDMSMLTGKSRKELQELIPVLTDLAKETSSTITEVAQLTTEYMRQGRTLKDSLELSKQTARAAKIAGISVSDSLNYMTSAINGFNLAASDAERVSDIFAKVGAATATSYEDLAISLSKVSAQANTAGMSIEFTTALLAKGIETTQEAPESIGTALKTVLARMRELSDYGASLEDNTSINKVERALKAVGVELRDTTGQFRDMEEIFTELGPKWKTLNSMQQQAVAQAVAGTRQQSRFLAIMQDWDRTLEISAHAEESAGATRYQYAKQAEGLQATLTRLTTEWQNFVQQFTNNDLIMAGAEALEILLDKVNNFLSFVNQGKGGNGIVGTLTAVIVVLGVARDLLDRLVSPIREAFQNVQNISTALQQISGTQSQVNQNLQEELSLRDKIYQTIDASKRKSEEIHAQEKSIFKLITSGLRSRINNSKKITAQAKSELGLAGKLTKEERKQLKEKKKTIKTEKSQAKLKTKTYKEQVAAAQEEYDNSKAAVKQAQEKHLATQRDVELAKQNVELKKQAIDAAHQAYQAAASIEDNEQAILEMQNATLQLEQAQSDLDAAQLQLQQAQTAEGKAQKGIEEATNQQRAKAVMLEEAKSKSLGKVVLGKLKEFAFSVGTALTNYVTMALAGIAIGAVTSLIGNIGANISGAKARETINNNQEKLYENKEKKNTISSLADEYRELKLKVDAQVATQDDVDRLKEIADSLQEQDPSIIGDDILGAADRVIAKLDEDNKKLMESTKKAYAENAKKSNKDAKKYMYSDEGISAFQELAQFTLEQSGLYNDSSMAVLTTLVNNLDYEELVTSGTNMITLYNKIAQVSGSYGEDLEEAGDNLYLQIKAYNKVKEQLSNDNSKTSQELLQIIKQNNVGLEVLSNKSKTVAELLDQNLDSSKILALSNSLITLGASIDGVGNALDILNRKMVTTSGDLTESYLQMLKDSVNYTDDNWKKIFGEGWTALDSDEQLSKIVQYQDQLKLLATGLNMQDIGDRITNLSSVKDTSRDIATKLRSGDALDLADYDTLEELGLMADAGFIDALYNNQVQAATMILEQLDNNTASLENTINKRIEAERITLAKDIDEFEKLQKVVLDKDGNLRTDEHLADEVIRYKQLESSIQLTTASIATGEAKLKSIAAETIKIDKYTASIAIKTSVIAKLQEEIDKNPTLDSFKKLNTALEEAKQLTATELNDQWAHLAKSVGLTTEQLKASFIYTDEGYVPALEDGVEAWQESLHLTGEQANWLLENLDTVNDINASLEDTIKLQEEQLQLMMESVATIQEEFIDAYSEALEKENEKVQESLDQRTEMYERYFADLEDKSSATNYETDRNTLINRIAALSTATDSASLAKLKEAQTQLQELNKERAAEELEKKQEAVMERLENQRMAVEAELTKRLEDANKLWAEILDKMSDGSDDEIKTAIKNMLYSNYDSLTSVQQYLADQLINSRFDALQSYGFQTSDYNAENLVNQLQYSTVAAEPVTINNGGAITNNNTTLTATLGDIYINGEKSSQDIQNDVEKAVFQAFQDIAKQFGFNISLSGGA